ncbi:hypothetical protein GASC598P17_013090 [Gilliamella apis SCGC AB-598-P17]|nr:hypothetical protein GASC598P17_013090 [Gilliamella apis SCGC AB-598-P17]
MKKLCLFLMLFSFTAITHAEEKKPLTEAELASQAKEVEVMLSNPKIGAQFPPLSKTDEDNTIGYSYLDKNSIKLHPYNNKIRIFKEVSNYVPALVQNIDNVKTPYHTVVINYYANCDKKEIAKGKIELIENYFAEGKLINTIDIPSRWMRAEKGDEKHKLMVIACSLPLNS